MTWRWHPPSWALGWLLGKSPPFCRVVVARFACAPPRPPKACWGGAQDALGRMGGGGLHKDLGLREGAKLCPQPPPHPGPSLVAFTPKFEPEKCFAGVRRVGYPPQAPPCLPDTPSPTATEALGGASPCQPQSPLPQLSSAHLGEVQSPKSWRSPGEGHLNTPPLILSLIYKILYPLPQQSPHPPRDPCIWGISLPSLLSPLLIVEPNPESHKPLLALGGNKGSWAGGTRGPGGSPQAMGGGSSAPGAVPHCCVWGGRGYRTGSPPRHSKVGGCPQLQLGSNPCSKH